MNREELLYNQRYLRQIQELQNRSNSSFNNMFRRPSMLNTEEDFF